MYQMQNEKDGKDLVNDESLPAGDQTQEDEEDEDDYDDDIDDDDDDDDDDEV